MITISKILTFTPLKKLIAIVLLLQVISNNAFAEELIKLPRLFTHYHHHAQEHNDTHDFLDFLHKHYSDHHKHVDKHSGEDKDCNLPFKHCGGCCINAHAPAAGFVSPEIIADYNFILATSLKYPVENDRILSTDLGSIWQPPRLAY